MESTTLDETLERYDERRANLIPILQDIQATYSYLPEDVLRRVSRKLHVSLPDLYQVATFYRCFSLKPRGKHVVQVCLGTACHVRGGPKILDRVETETGTVGLGTSPDLEFVVETVRCLGCCGLAPVMKVDRDVYASLEQSKVKQVLNRYRRGRKRSGGKDADRG
ncbi:MAG TPA: NAD(P)H-dependent oxidoreductase subunit E [Steroidobacteraceae bacterium]|nr:NAD(P)H-dependent oxidoreductase subunit E [Steroidobacteraceae bacterium]